tara:strand:- start:111 stop:419 length:309 start_codon:yes stop_codon:yes gene_type:complete
MKKIGYRNISIRIRNKGEQEYTEPKEFYMPALQWPPKPRQRRAVRQKMSAPRVPSVPAKFAHEVIFERYDEQEEVWYVMCTQQLCSIDAYRMEREKCLSNIS